MKKIYLDYNASTPLEPEVAEDEESPEPSDDSEIKKEE